jgi:phospholipase C
VLPRFAVVALVILVVAVSAACGGVADRSGQGNNARSGGSGKDLGKSPEPGGARGHSIPSGIHKIKHVVIIMQENRSFDSYFGTYPGADGIPMKDGKPTACVPDPKTNQCVKPFHNPKDLNYGGPHEAIDAKEDIDGGKMDGFIRQELIGQ